MKGENLFHDRYFKERLLGRGNFSEVWLAKDTKTDIEVALKIYAPATGLDDDGLNVLAREFAIVVNANHKNLLKPLYYDQCDRRPYLVLPYCSKGSIMKEINKMTEDEAWRLLRDTADGLAFLHAMNPPIIHQDIKPDNIMIDENDNYVITDFGVSTRVRSTLRKSMSQAFASAGTVAYMAPERFGQNNTPIMANDIYSLAVTIYEMLTGDTPFGDDGGLMQKKGADIPQLPNKYSPELRKVLTKCLCTDPWKRPTAEQLAKYASDHIAKKPIRFVDEKTFMQKYGLFVIIGAVLAVAGLTFLGITLKKQADEKAIAEAQARQEEYNDSVNDVAKRYIALADSLLLVGNEHYEGYDAAYLAVIDNLKLAEKTAALANPVTVQISEETLAAASDSLRIAYAQLQAKAQMFAEDPDFADLAETFRTRAEKIAAKVDIDTTAVTKKVEN